MRITENHLRRIIRNVIKENTELGIWDITQGKLDQSQARTIMS